MDKLFIDNAQNPLYTFPLASSVHSRLESCQLVANYLVTYLLATRKRKQKVMMQSVSTDRVQKRLLEKPRFEPAAIGKRCCYLMMNEVLSYNAMMINIVFVLPCCFSAIALLSSFARESQVVSLAGLKKDYHNVS